MEDKDIRNIFDAYNPKLNDDFNFMIRLERNLDAVEIVKKNNKEYLRRNRLAMIISLVIAFASGFVCAYWMPELHNLLLSISPEVKFKIFFLSAEDCSLLFAWSIIALIIITFAWSAYNVTLALIPNRKKH